MAFAVLLKFPVLPINQSLCPIFPFLTFYRYLCKINYRTSSLFHYTTYNGLKSILKQGIIPNYCKEDFSTDKNNLVVGIPMVSFCDIPLTRTDEFTKRYGNHAIGLSKEWALKNQINPILYINNEEIITSLKFYKEYKSSLNANLNLFGFSKKYMGEHNKKGQCNYEENEWRYILKEEDGITWKWGETEYSTWRGSEDKKPEPDTFLKARTLKFGIDDISYIIVEFEKQGLRIVDYISKLPSLRETDSVLGDEDKKLLYSKIISIERIRTDF